MAKKKAFKIAEKTSNFKTLKKAKFSVLFDTKLVKRLTKNVLPGVTTSFGFKFHDICEIQIFSDGKISQIEGRSALLSYNVNKVSRIFLQKENLIFAIFLFYVENFVKSKGDLYC